jgi:quercetin dioxygenase-like cupin family protein
MGSKPGMLAGTLEDAMPDLFPTTNEAEKDQNIADAAAGKRSIVNHLGSESFEKDGLRPSFEYRPLGLKELTGGKVGAHVIRAKPGQHADAPRHTHTLEFQFVYVLKGWAIFDYEGYGEHKLVAGSAVYQPPGIRHKEIDHSEDFEVLEITMPADFATTEVK